MKTLLTMIALSCALLISTSDLSAQGRGKGRCTESRGGGRGTCTTALDAMPKEDLSADEAAVLQAMREEEKLARDVYLMLGETYDERVFTNIPRAEQRHMDSVATLLERYGLDDPTAGLAAGEFRTPEVQALYDDLVARGGESLTAALTVGATIEDLDIKDLNEAAETIDNADVLMVFENLNRGSRNHMRAFVRRLEAQGATYEAQYISQDELATILASDHESGGKGRRGAGRGQGRGRGGRGACAN